MLFFTAKGYASELLWPNSVWWNQHALISLLLFQAVMFAAFSRRFLNLASNLPTADKVALAAGWIIAFSLLAYLYLPDAYLSVMVRVALAYVALLEG